MSCLERPADQGLFFGVRLVVGAVVSSAFFRGELSPLALMMSADPLPRSRPRASSPPFSRWLPSRTLPAASNGLGAFRRWTIEICANCLSRGSHAVLFHRKLYPDPLRMWAKKLIEKKPLKLVAVALANKMACIAFAILRLLAAAAGALRSPSWRKFRVSARQSPSPPM